MTLVILAAGMGSRYGGLKQIDPITDQGEFIIDFSIYDAVLNGFDKVVFVIKEENLADFRDTVGKRFEDKVKVEYAFQKMDDLPAGYSLPQGRTKPWGTAHALLAARHIVNEPFAVINADDFYGRSAYALLSKHLKAMSADSNDYGMIGYILEKTLTENGAVSRGICQVNEQGDLYEIIERTAIHREGDHAVYTEGNQTVSLPLSTIASMNCWGFSPAIFPKVMKGFETFLESLSETDLKKEYYLPFAVCDLMQKKECTVRVYLSQNSWYGVTYLSDKDSVFSALKELKDSGVYPEYLNGGSSL